MWSNSRQSFSLAARAMNGHLPKVRTSKDHENPCTFPEPYIELAIALVGRVRSVPCCSPRQEWGLACLAVALGVPALSFLFLFLRALGSLGLGRYVVGSVRI